MTAEQYAAEVIKTALHNGLSLEQIAAADPAKLAAAYYKAQLAAIYAAAEELKTAKQ